MTEEDEDAGSAGGDRSIRSRTRSPTSGRASSWSWPTTPTGRTRATSSWPPTACHPEAITFMVRHTSGVICMPVTGERLDELRLPLMVAAGNDPQRTAFTVSVDVRARAPPRASPRPTARPRSARSSIPATGPEDLARPGHVFPLRYCEGGVLKRAGHTEAAVDLARLAGLSPAGVLCEVVNDDGTMARLPDLRAFADRHGLKLISIADLIEYRRRTEKLVQPGGRGDDPDRARRVPHARVREPGRRRASHVAMVLGDIGDGERHPGARALGMPHRRRVRFAPLRLRHAAPGRAAADRRGGPRRRAVHPGPRGPRDRPGAQAARLRAAGAGTRHRRGERRAGVRARSPRLRDRRADPGRPRRPVDAPADEQPVEARRAGGVRPLDRRARAAGDAADAAEPRVPADEAGEARAPAGRPRPRGRRPREAAPVPAAAERADP